MVLLTLVISSALAATTINVPDDYSTIQAALTAADSSDTVLVQPGTYFENIFWPDVNGIKLLSAGDSSNTVIDGGANGSVIYMNPSTATIDSTTEIRGFKITNGGNIANGGGMFVSNASPVLAQLWITSNEASNFGGGLYIPDCSPALRDVTVSGNAGGPGGGLYIGGSSPMLTNMTVTGNGAYSGGGLFIVVSSPILTGVTVTGNTASGGGGGLNIIDSGPTLTDVTVTGNTANDNGGGLAISGGGPTLTNMTVTGNTASGGGGGLYIWSSSPTLTDMTVSGNTASSYGGGVSISSGNPTLTDMAVISNTASLGGGLYIGYGSPMLLNVTITQNSSGIYIISGTPTIAGSNIEHNGMGLYNADNTIMVSAVTNWWGDATGPYHPQQNPGGLGDSVNAFVNIIPFLTEPDTAAPPIPVQNLVVTNQGDDFIELAWDASPISDLAGYSIYLNVDSTGNPYADTVDAGHATSVTLSDLEPGLTYYMAVTCYDTDGNESWYSAEVSAVTTLGVSREYEIPSDYTLHPGYPNPFNPSITLPFDLPKGGPISLVIHDIMGREVIRLADGDMTAGYHQVVWNGKGTDGRTLPTGIYIARLTTPDYSQSIKMLLLK
ncbi:MAG: fibronectin type III domain-containing protein [Candidatus Marinimicrobia bacterium]|nr:fibronectin type III domain-containing protein [Candidatus Neomarinimicrobiota bacterium]